jgi:predicted metalloprotease
MRLDNVGESGNVEDRRGMKPAIAGGGILVVIIGLVAAYFGIDPNVAQQVAGGLAGQVQQHGPPPKDGMVKFSKQVLGSTDAVWKDQFQSKLRKQYEPPTMVLFSEQVDSEGCGVAPSEVGPFYCPRSRKVFVDPTFFDELEGKLGGSKADFSKAYVIAHEVGHHVQNLLGYNARVKEFERREGKNAGVRLELQADYLAGVWAHHAEKKYQILERGDVEEAIKTANSIGDDRIQKKAGRWVSPESFTHGSAAARERWFSQGLKTGDVSILDDFFTLSLGQLDPALR